MKQIKKWLYVTIEADATFRTLTGRTATDPRIYYGWMPEVATLSDTKPAYSTYFEIVTGPVPEPQVMDVQHGDEIYQIDVWAQSMETMEDVSNRIYAVLHDQRSVDAYSTYKIQRVHMESKSDIMEEDEGGLRIYRKSMTFRCEVIYDL